MEDDEKRDRKGKRKMEDESGGSSNKKMYSILRDQQQRGRRRRSSSLSIVQENESAPPPPVVPVALPTNVSISTTVAGGEGTLSSSGHIMSSSPNPNQISHEDLQNLVQLSVKLFFDHQGTLHDRVNQSPQQNPTQTQSQYNNYSARYNTPMTSSDQTNNQHVGTNYIPADQTISQRREEARINDGSIDLLSRVGWREEEEEEHDGSIDLLSRVGTSNNNSLEHEGDQDHDHDQNNEEEDDGAINLSLKVGRKTSK